VLTEWRRASTSELVFPIPEGKTRRTIHYDFERIQKVAGIAKADHYCFQNYRSTCATELLEAGWSVPHVKDWLGHAKSSTVLERYYANTLRGLGNLGRQRRVV
jgi:integrase